MRSRTNQSGIIDYIILFAVAIAVLAVVYNSIQVPPAVKQLVDAAIKTGGEVLGSYVQN